IQGASRQGTSSRANQHRLVTSNCRLPSGFASKSEPTASSSVILHSKRAEIPVDWPCFDKNRAHQVEQLHHQKRHQAARIRVSSDKDLALMFSPFLLSAFLSVAGSSCGCTARPNSRFYLPA